MEVGTTLADQFTVVVVGNMNPALHHPTWYLVDDQSLERDVKAALDAGRVVATSAFSSFEGERVAIQCTPERWVITASKRGDFSLALTLANRTFERLYETPLTAFGFNLDYSGLLRLPDPVRDDLAERFGLPLKGFTLQGEPVSVPVAEKMQFTLRTTTTVELGGAVSKLRVNLHCDLDVKLPKFDFAPLLERASLEVAGADAIAKRILSLGAI